MDVAQAAGTGNGGSRVESEIRTVPSGAIRLRAPLRTIGAAARTALQELADGDHGPQILDLLRNALAFVAEQCDEIAAEGLLWMRPAAEPPGTVPLADLVRGVARRLDPLARLHQVTIDLSIDERATIQGRRRDLARAITETTAEVLAIAPPGAWLRLVVPPSDHAQKLLFELAVPGDRSASTTDEPFALSEVAHTVLAASRIRVVEPFRSPEPTASGSTAVVALDLPVGPRQRPGRVLIADDSHYVRSRLRTVLEAAGLTVVGEATNGVEAVTLYKRLWPDVVTMDLVMPGMDGFSAIRTILQLHLDARIAVVSSIGDSQRIVEAIQAGARDFLVKPFDPEQTVRRIERLLPSGHRRRFPRFDVRTLPIEVRLGPTGDAQHPTIAARAIDLGLGGLRVLVESPNHPFRSGTSIECTLQVLRRRLSVVARLAWCQGNELGISFEELEGPSLESLKGVVLEALLRSRDASILNESFRTAASLFSLQDLRATNASELGRIIGSDPVLTLKLLTMANAPGLGTHHKIEGIDHAIAFLGVERVLSMAITTILQDGIARKGAERESAIWNHSLAVGLLARELCQARAPRLSRHFGFTIGLLHDVGLLLLEQLFETDVAELVAETGGEEDALVVRESERFGFDHAEVGGMVLRNAGLPETYSHCVLYHHLSATAVGSDPLQLVPAEMRDAVTGYVEVLEIAESISYWAGFGVDGRSWGAAPLDPPPPVPGLAPAEVESLCARVRRELETWLGALGGQ